MNQMWFWHGTQSEPQPMVISEELKRKHEESVAQYPQLNLRKVNMLSWTSSVTLSVVKVPPPSRPLSWCNICLLFVSVTDHWRKLRPQYHLRQLCLVSRPCSLYWRRYGAWQFGFIYKTNFTWPMKSVIQEIQESLFSRHEQTVSLGSIGKMLVFGNRALYSRWFLTMEPSGWVLRVKKPLHLSFLRKSKTPNRYLSLTPSFLRMAALVDVQY